MQTDGQTNQLPAVHARRGLIIVSTFPGACYCNDLFFRFPRVHIAVRAGAQIMVEGTRVFTTVLSVVSLIDGNCLKTGDRQEGWSIMKDLVADEFEILLYTK